MYRLLLALILLSPLCLLAADEKTPDKKAADKKDDQKAAEPDKQHKEAIVWTLTADIDTPESAYFDPESQVIFVSNVVGGHDEKDGKGYISKVSLQGKMLTAQWAKGLNAPKGLRSYGGLLWVSDIDRVLSFDMKTAKQKNEIKIAGAKFLNDVAIDNDGRVYVSDTKGNKVYRIDEGKASVFIEGDACESPNGLLVHDDKLIVAGWGNDADEKTGATKTPGRVYAVELKRTSPKLAEKEKELITPKPLGNLDGLENDGSGGYYVTDWLAGKVYRLSSDGLATEILSGYKMGTADIGIVADKLLILPRMTENVVNAFDLEKLGQ